MSARWLAAAAALVLATSASAQTKPSRPQQPPAAIPVWDRLERFNSEAEFRRYLTDVQSATGRRRDFEMYDSVGAGAPMPPPPPPPPPPPSPSTAPSAAADSGVMLTGSAVSQATSGEPSSITNTQTQGVDEGGIVKQIGRFLVVLQDGRLFVVDTRAGPEQRGLALTNRTNVYRSPRQDTWFDEMLTSGNRVLVAGYSYRERASEITVLTLGDDGQLTREATYYISSNDYYDVENYATRLVNGNLVIYTPLDVSYIDPRSGVQWPLVRRWIRDGEERAVTTRGRALFDAQDIYKPIQRLHNPTVHSVSVCPLGDLRSGDEFECRTTAFVGGAQREFFVSTADIYLWMTPNQWDDSLPACGNNTVQSLPATLYQVPLNADPPRALFARGVPMNQLALDSSPTEFRALLNQNTRCGRGDDLDVTYLRAPFSALSSRPREIGEGAYTATPSPGGASYEVRYTSTHVVYGAREGYRSAPPAGSDAPVTARVIAVPLDRPRAAVTVDAPHNVIRLERAGGDIILTGYRTDAGLSVSRLSLQGRPRITHTEVLDNRYESEGRSHAFNALVGPEGDGLMGLPTVSRVKQGGRWHWRSEASDVSFLTFNRDGAIADAGALQADPNARDPSYQCEVSCVDWYGNTRALFIGNRVFGLSATELIEGALENGRVVERQRLNLSRPIGPPRR